jgi:hypothetical protein
MSEREGEMTDYEAIYNDAVNDVEVPPESSLDEVYDLTHNAGIAAVVAAAKAEALEEAAVIAEGVRLTLDDLGYEQEAIADSIRAAKEATQ